MFENLSDRLSATLKNITGRGRLTEDNIKDTLREVRMALLEADVALPVVMALIESIKTRAIGQDVMASLTIRQIDDDLKTQLRLRAAANDDVAHDTRDDLPAYAELHCLSDFSFLRGASSADHCASNASSTLSTRLRVQNVRQWNLVSVPASPASCFRSVSPDLAPSLLVIAATTTPSGAASCTARASNARASSRWRGGNTSTRA